MENWQIGFKVKGLLAPTEETVFDDYISIKGIPPSHEAYVFFKVAIQSKEEIDKLRSDLSDVLRNIIRIYGLVTDHYAEVQSGSVSAKISSEHPFGSTKPLPDLVLIPVFDDDRRRKEVPLLRRTIEKYESVKQILEGRRKSYLRNAIDYFHRSLGDERYEEKLIDLMIAMESLFSKEGQELRLRLSLRAAFLLSVGKEDERSEIFTTVYDLYHKRSLIVHGTERVDLTYEEIARLRSYVQESIKRLINVVQRKDKFLELVDQTVYDENKRQKLKELVSNSLSQWET